MGGVEGRYENGRWKWETSGLFAIPGAIIDAVEESDRKKRYIEEQRRENERRREEERIERENQRRKIEETKNKINKKIKQMEKDFKKTFTIKEVKISPIVKKNILKTCDSYYNTQKINEEIKKSYFSLNSGKRTKPKFTVFIIGNTGNGKSTLVNACFKEYLSAESDVIPCHDLKIPKAFTHENLPDFEIYDTNGIEINGENSIENRFKEISDFIEQKGSDSNNMIDCVWYCITGERFQDEEKMFLKKLNEIYFEKFPIILVYTQTKNLKIAKKMENYSLEFFPKNVFVPVLAKDVNLIGNSKIEKFGVDDLINKTRELIISKENELRKINAIKTTEKIIKEKYLIDNCYDCYSKIIKNKFNIDNEQNVENCVNEIKKCEKKIEQKILKDGVEQLFKNIEKEINKIMAQSGTVVEKNLSEEKKKFEKKMILKENDSKKINTEIKKLIIQKINEIILDNIKKDINLLN